ncbi:MAG: glycosyltransferase family 2 protein [Candidatus Hydrogenedentota bacterium]
MPSLVSIVVPFYNEEENVRRLYERIAAVFADLPGYAFECLLVNDGSTDGTREALGSLAAQDDRVRPVHLAGNHGQSAALYTGMVRSRGEYILTLDGDLQNDPADFPRFLELLEEHACVCGYRVNRHDTVVRRASGKVANAVRNAILHDGVRDTGCGTKGFRRVCLRYFVCFNGLHRFLPVFVRMAGLSIVEVPVKHHARQYGVSKYGIGNRLWRGLYDLIGVAWLRRRIVVVTVEEDTGP